MSAQEERINLCEVLDRVLNKGVVISGEITISVANVDLIWLALQAIVTSVDKGNEMFIPWPVAAEKLDGE